MMQNLLINTPFTGKLVSAPELFDRAVAPATSPPLPSLKSPNLCGRTFVYQNRYWNAHTSPTEQHTHWQPHVHQHWAWCFLPHTETYPVFMMARLFLKACLSHSKLIHQSRRAISGLSHSGTDACSQWDGKLGGLGNQGCLKQQSVPDGIPGSINPWRGQREFPYSPSTGPTLTPWGSLLSPLFLPCCPILEAESTPIAIECAVPAGCPSTSRTIGGCSTR